MSANLNIDADVNSVSRIPVVATILEVICRTTGMGFAAIARVTEDKWVACAVRDEIEFGLQPGGELKIETTICNEIRQSSQPVVIDHVAIDANYCKHHTPAMYGFQSYISVPIILKDGSFFGTLCAIDPRPARLNNPAITGMFNMFTDLLSFHINVIDQLNVAKADLLEEKQTAELREQFIAILGHDLRNPVTAVSNAAQLLLRMPTDDRVKRLSTIIYDSTFRINELINNILDFARGRLGDGITLKRSDDAPLKTILEQVITELQIVWPNRQINIQYDLNHPVSVDGKRIAQLFSNLLSNAINYGDKDKPVIIEANATTEGFGLTVANAGKKIPDEVMEKLFRPFSRGEVEPRQQGLGLGLYIASQIAIAHGGTLTVQSTNEKTQFSLKIPNP